MSDEEVIENVSVNVMPMMFMARFLGAEMRDKTLKGGPHRAAIINMTSYYSQWGARNMPLFCSSKSFDDVWSITLGYENPEMDVLTVRHMPSKSVNHPNGVDPKETVDGVLKDLGKTHISYGHWKHSMFRYYILQK